MAKRIIWTNTAKQARRDILQFWINHNKSKTYSQKIICFIKRKDQSHKRSELYWKTHQF